MSNTQNSHGGRAGVENLNSESSDAYLDLTWGSYNSLQKFTKPAEAKKLETKIDDLQDILLGKNLSHEKFNSVLQTLNFLKSASLENEFLSIGEQAPDFMLKDAQGKVFQLSEAVKKGKVVLNFFRGGWCPYCYLELRGLQEFLPEFKKLSAQVVAVSSEKPDYCLNTQERNGLQFPILSDKGNRVAQDFKLVYKSDIDIDLWGELGLQDAISSGDISYELPVPATYVIDEWMTIRYVYADPDYRNRVKPEFLLGKLRFLNKDERNKK